MKIITKSTNNLSRRRFIELTSIASIASACTPLITRDKSAKESLSKLNGPFEHPFVISTWNNVKANEAAFTKLSTGAAGLDAIESGIHVPESDVNDRSVGKGGRPDRSGRVTLDACIMDAKGRAGSVCAVKNYEHPISIARKVMELTPHVILVGEGAEKFAAENGFPKIELLTKESELEYKKWLETSHYKPKVNIELHDTIGMIAMDNRGDAYGGCSTSGMAYKMEGRVGDSPIIGAGLYVDNAVGACTGTGQGEYVLRSLSSFLVVEYMRAGMHPQLACEKAIKQLMQQNSYFKDEYQVGLIAFDKKGNIGAHSVVKGFVYAFTNKSGSKVYDSSFAI